MEKKKIVVGNTEWHCKTIPINIIFDEVFDNRLTDPEKPILERFRILEIDGTFLVIEESHSIQNYKAFLTLEDALSYLEMFGISTEDDEREDLERIYD